MPLPSWRTTNGPPSPSDAIRVSDIDGGVDGVASDRWVYGLVGEGLFDGVAGAGWIDEMSTSWKET